MNPYAKYRSKPRRSLTRGYSSGCARCEGDSQMNEKCPRSWSLATDRCRIWPTASRGRATSSLTCTGLGRKSSRNTEIPSWRRFSGNVERRRNLDRSDGTLFGLTVRIVQKAAVSMGEDAYPRRSLRVVPVLDDETLDSSKLSDVPRHQNGIRRESGGGDQDIDRADRFSRLFEFC